jgi:predicted DNA-binding transcriptional regulator AlpA
MDAPTKVKLPGRFLRKKEVCEITSLSPTQLQDRIKKKEFEPGTRLTENSNILVWWEPTIVAWVERRLAARGSPTDRVRAEKCEARARNAASHRRTAKRTKTAGEEQQ